MEELKITKERVLSAAGKCGTAKEVLKELFPEAFGAEWENVSGKCIVSPSNGGVYSLTIKCGNDNVLCIRTGGTWDIIDQKYKFEDCDIWRKKSE